MNSFTPDVPITFFYKKIRPRLSGFDPVGWPGTMAAPIYPKFQPDGTPWPKISIITPSFNQAEFIEETIRSVLLQNYPHLEYIIIDGGSTDGSVDIIKRYAPKLSYWISEPDRGQSQAILKGFARATGEIIAWINSDDLYAPGALMEVAKAAFKNPGALWFAGRCDILEEGVIKHGWRWQGSGIEEWYIRSCLMQPGVFWRKQLWLEKGGLDENLHYSFDYDLWLRFASVQTFPLRINNLLAYYRSHEATKTSTHPERFGDEDLIVKQKNAHLWQAESVRARLNRLIKREKACELIINAQLVGNLAQRFRTVADTVHFSPSILLYPKAYYFMLRTLINYR